LIFPTIFFSEKFITLKRIHRDIIINLYQSSCKASVTVVRFQPNLNSFQQSFVKSYTKFHENSSSGTRAVPCGRKDRHGSNSQFRNFM